MGSLDDKLTGWDAALVALIRQLELYKVRGDLGSSVARGWDDAIQAAKCLRGAARTQKGFLARECAALSSAGEGEQTA